MTENNRTPRIGESPIYYEELSSTMDYLREHAYELPAGAAVYAGRQTKGRGRRGKAWQDAPPGVGLSLSVLLRPRLEPGQFPLIPLTAGLAVLRALRKLAAGEYFIKWPNDIVLGGKKLCGILCETQWGKDVFCVLGLGVNLMQDAAFFKACGLPHATSIYEQTGERVTMEEMCRAVCRELDCLLPQLETEGFSRIRQEYEAACISVGRRVCVSTAGTLREGEALGVDGEGRLLVQFEDGVQPVCSGEASVRGLYGYV